MSRLASRSPSAQPRLAGAAGVIAVGSIGSRLLGPAREAVIADRLLEIAVAGRADGIVTGDEDLLALHPPAGIPIVAPNPFLAMLDESW